MKIIGMVLMAIGVVCNVYADDSVSRFSREVEIIAESDKDGSREKHKKIVELYNVEFGGSLATLDIPSLRERLDGALTASFYSKDTTIARDAALIYRVLSYNGALRDDDTMRVIAALVKVRSFEWANDLLIETGRPSLPSVEWAVDGPDPEMSRIIVVRKNHLLIQSLDKDRVRNGVIVVANPLCGFSAAAGEAIAQDQGLSEAFKDALWLVPQEGNLHAENVALWNRIHPFQQMVLAFDWLEWPQIDDWSTPTFYFFADGQLIDRVRGWPLDGSKAFRLHIAVSAWRSAKR